MDIWLGRILLHDSLHGCLAERGTGSGIIKAKLAQQLVHLEQTPLFGVFIDLKKAFDAMDRGSTPWGGPADASIDPQLLGDGNECMPCEGELRPAF